MSFARPESIINSQTQTSGDIRPTITTDWQASRDLFTPANGYRPNDQTADATRSREGKGFGPKTIDGSESSVASAAVGRSTDVINYSSEGGFLHIPKEIEGVRQTADNSQVQGMPKTETAPKQPGLTAPEVVPPLPEPTDGGSYPAACDSLPGTNPAFDETRGSNCPQPGIRSQSQSG